MQQGCWTAQYPAALCALQLAHRGTNPPAQILHWQCTQQPPALWVRGAPQPPVCIFLKTSAPYPRAEGMFQLLGQCLQTGNVVRIPGLGILSPSGVSTVCQGCCCCCAGSTRLGKSNINWAACLQEAEAALEESSTTVQRACSEIWFLGSPCCSNQETSVSGSLGKTGLPGEYVEESTAGFAKQAPKVQQLGSKKQSWSQVSLGLPSWLAGRHTVLTL